MTPDDGICGMVEELYTAEEEGKGKKSMFAILLEEMKQQLSQGGPCTRFSFVVKFISSHFTGFLMVDSQ